MASVVEIDSTKQLLSQRFEFDSALPAYTISAIDPTPADKWYVGGNIQ